MEFFDGIQFIRWFDTPEHTKYYEKSFGDYFAIQYNHYGKFVFSCDDSNLKEYTGPHIFVTRPGLVFRYGVQNQKPRHHCYICFRGPRVKQYIQKGLLPESPQPIAIANPDTFHMSMTELMGLLDQGPSVYDMSVHAFEGLLLQIHQQPRLSTQNKSLLNQLEQVASDIRKHPEKTWIFEDISKRIGISYAHFRRLFKQYIGMPPSRFVLTNRIQRAANMLANSNLPLIEIAEQARCSDIYHFSKLFKKQFALPPAQYRKAFSQTESS